MVNNKIEYNLEELPKDLEILCNNEIGSYTILQSKKTGQVFTIFRTNDLGGEPTVILKQLRNEKMTPKQ